MIHTFIAMLLFAFFAITGLIVDVGFARLTQRQMAQATDAASIEGVRLRDTVGTQPDDAARRDAVSAIVDFHFDDDFLVTADDSRNYGAGPQVTLGPGMTSIGANRKLEVDPDHPVFKPSVQWNMGNSRHGDLVGGIFDAGDDVHHESAAYYRTDFEPANAVYHDDPTDRSLGAFLVRLRRTTNDYGLDQVPGVSSGGPTLPYIFGQGSMIAPEVRERGITVRATGVAGARRATLVGLPDVSAGLPGATPFLLEHGYWNSFSDGQMIRLRFRGDGRIVGPSSSSSRPRGGPPMPNPFFPYNNRGGPPIIPPGQIGASAVPVGMLSYRGHSHYPYTSGSSGTRRSWSIGDDAIPTDLSWSQIMSWLGYPDRWGYVSGAVYFYVPLYYGTVNWDGRPGRQPGEAFKEGDPRVVGFATVAVVRADVDGLDWWDDDDYPEIDIVKLASYVAPYNASAVETPGLAGTFAETVMDRFRTVDEPLRAAARVR